MMSIGMRGRFVIGIFFLSVIGNTHLAQAAEGAKVAIRQVDGRTEAVVTVKKLEPTPEGEKDVVRETLTVVEEGALEVMGTSNELVGRGTDQAVQTVQSVGDSIFSWFFRMLDVKGARESEVK